MAKSYLSHNSNLSENKIIHVDTEFLLKRGLEMSTGRLGKTDYIEAHKWFNIASMKGSTKAHQYRREIAREMSEQQIAAALTKARQWIKKNNNN